MNTNTEMSKKQNPNSGFTLLEITFVLLIFGLIVAAFSPLYSMYLKVQAEETTASNMDNIRLSISEFLAVNGRYPCPAPPRIDRDDNTGKQFYGRESTECALATGAKTIASGACDNAVRNTATAGICIEDSLRTADAEEHRVIIGVLPFRQLNLREQDVFDGYGNQITYAVTENLANKQEYERTGGGITVIDIMGAPLTEDDASTPTENESSRAHFFLLSHGENGYGAYTLAGAQIDCTNASATEAENCYGPAGNGTFRIAEKSSNRGDASEYDDYSVSYIPEDLPYWELTDGVGNEHINLMEAGGKVGVRTANPYTDTLSEELDVGGIVRAREKLNASELCSYGNDAECFASEKLAGDDPDMECDPNQYSVELSNGELVCSDEVIVDCPPNEYMIGINADGSPNCAPELPLNCPATPVQICPADPPAIIPATDHNDVTPWVRSASFPGNERRRRYRCRNGTFRNHGGWRGVCDCVEEVVNLENVACGDCQTGTFTRTWRRECPSGNIVMEEDRSTCECTLDAQAGNCRDGYTETCDPGFIYDDPMNPPRYERIYQCTGTTPNGYGSYAKVPGTGNCICDDLGDDTRYKACSAQRAGFTEKLGESGIPEIRYFDCGRTPPGYGAWELDTDETTASTYDEALDVHCECDNSTPDQTYNRQCDVVYGTATEQYSGVIPYRREWDCTLDPPAYLPEEVDHTPSLTNDADIIATYCTIIPPVECEWKPNVAGSPPRAEFPGPNLNTSQRSCDCDTEAGDVTVCHRTIGDGSKATVYNECICQPR